MNWDDLLVSLGEGADQEPLVTTLSPSEWLSAARGRPAWQMWGKGRPTGGCPAHPVLCHMIDVAAVAALLLTQRVPSALQRRLLRVHPAGEATALRLLIFVIALHDLGKITPAFQAKLPWANGLLPGLGFDIVALPKAHHHGEVGLGLVRDEFAFVVQGRAEALALARAVTAHHGEFPTDATLQYSRGPRELGAKEAWRTARAGVVSELRGLTGIRGCQRVELDHADVVLLAGLTAVADWVGSMEEVFAYVPPQESARAYWPIALRRARIALDWVGMRAPIAHSPRTFSDLFPQHSPWPLHIAAERVASELQESSLVVVEAPMGEGKTEAALLLSESAAALLGQQGLYVGLPTQATANQMLGRIQTFLTKTHAQEGSNLLLAHGEASLVERFQKLAAVYSSDGEASGSVRAERWFLSSKRTLLAEFAVGTIDQALLGVLRTSHSFVRIYGLAAKTVVLDEVHAYDTYTTTLMERLIEWLAAVGATVVLLSATLPRARRNALVKAFRSGVRSEAIESAPTVVRYPRITVASRSGVSVLPFAPRREPVSLNIDRCGDDLTILAHDVIAAAQHGGCVGWILNTVARAQAACELVRSLAPDIPRILLHARLLPADRASREMDLERWLGPERKGVERPVRCIVIGTQVLEQSLDIDFDELFSDVAPVDLILQRAGRLFRHCRSNRSPTHKSPRLHIARPEGPWATVNLDSVAVVYAELLVRRTLRLLDGRKKITLPDDIETLVEEVYADDIPVADDALFGAYLDHYGARIAGTQNAQKRLMPRPTTEDDPFHDLRVDFDDDDDPGLHEELRALTRQGPPSVDIVCLVRRGGALFLDDHDPAPVDLGVEPDRVTVERLVRRSIGVSHRTLVRFLLGATSYQPDAWAKRALLKFRRVVEFTAGEATVGDVRLNLEPELGLVIQQP